MWQTGKDDETATAKQALVAEQSAHHATLSELAAVRAELEAVAQQQASRADEADIHQPECLATKDGEGETAKGQQSDLVKLTIAVLPSTVGSVLGAWAVWINGGISQLCGPLTVATDCFRVVCGQLPSR